ncbi:S9 family peptidase [Plantactinospora sp. B5E13]|uniref:S9 family peptidase n=1 Tax=unclassified Plantactinospora TaxID=2631981 RepID=UPI00325C81B9
MTQPPLIPRRVLFGEPAYAMPTLSPSGTHLAFLAPYEGGPYVWLGSLADRDFRPLTDLNGHPVQDYVWARDGRHLLYQSDRDGDERHHLISVDLVTGRTRDLTPHNGVRVQVIGLQRQVPHQVLVLMNLRSPEQNDLYRVDLRSGDCCLIESAAGLAGWLTDPQLRVCAAQRRNSDGGFTVMARDDEESDWRELLTLGYEDAADSQLLGFTGDGKDLLLLSPQDARTARLLRLSAVTGAVEVLYEDPGYDVVGASLHPVTGQVDIAVVERERIDLVAFSTETAYDLTRIRAASRGAVMPLGRDLANRRWLLQDNVDDGPTAFRLYERETGKVEELFTHQPELAGYPLARMEPVSYVARDGLTIHGYLTFPPGAARRGLPTVVNVHGGPWNRSRWGFRAESQWLANRGYLVVEVNYRGSTGYGRDFMVAGDREWGGRMQDDLVDAVRWVVDSGYADPDRVAITGISYGGYAALVGAAFTPELFRCAVAVAAPVNLRTFIESVPGYWKAVGNQLRRRVGDPETDAELLWSRSPLSRVADIRIPLLLAYGRNDPRVPISEADQLVEALRVHGVAHEYLLFPDEGHGFHKPHNALAFRSAAESFLARHLGGRREPD